MDTPILLILLLFISNQSNNKSLDTVHSIKNYIKDIQIDSSYTEEKINIAKKLSPLMPTEYVTPFNKSILFAEKFVRIYEVINFINSSELPQVQTVEMEPRVRLQKMLSTVQDEVKSSRIENLGMALELINNIDKYKKMFGMLSGLVDNKKPLTDTDNLMKLAESFLDVNDKEKAKEMSAMFDILKILNTNTTKKEKPND